MVAGFADSQEAYSPYPNALLCLRYINEVGKMVIGECNTEAGEVKEGDNLTSVKTSEKADTESTSVGSKGINLEALAQHCHMSIALAMGMSMAWCKTAVTPVHQQWHYHSLALSHKHDSFVLSPLIVLMLFIL